MQVDGVYSLRIRVAVAAVVGMLHREWRMEMCVFVF